jgi:hypothetical protein
MSNSSASTEVSSWAAIFLVTVLPLAIAYHPAHGSLIFGPTSPFWILSPISAILDSFAIILRLAKFPTIHILGRYLYDSKTATSKSFSFRDRAYAILAARYLNASKERRSTFARAHSQPRNYDREMKVLIDVCKQVNAAILLHIFVMVPIVAQFLKIAFTKHIYMIKILGSIFFIHWLTLELLILLANSSRNLGSFKKDQIKDIVTSVNELLLLDDTKPKPDGSDSYSSDAYYSVFDEQLYALYDIIFAAYIYGGAFAFIAVVLITEELDIKSLVGYGAIAIFYMVSANFMPGFCEIPIKSKSKVTEGVSGKSTGYKTNATQSSSKTLHGGPNVGGATGAIMFISWAIWCVMCYDGKGTERPDWQWVDWLG